MRERTVEKKKAGKMTDCVEDDAALLIACANELICTAEKLAAMAAAAACYVACVLDPDPVDPGDPIDPPPPVAPLNVGAVCQMALSEAKKALRVANKGDADKIRKWMKRVDACSQTTQGVFQSLKAVRESVA